MYKKYLKQCTFIIVSSIFSITIINSHSSAYTSIPDKNTDSKYQRVANIKQLKNEASQPQNSSPYKKIQVTPGPWKIARSVAISRDGQIIVSGDDEGEVQFWSPDTGKLIRSIKAHSGNVVSVAITPNGKIIASRSFGDKQIKLWDLNTGQLIRSINAGSVGGVNSLAISPDGKTLAGYFNNQTVRIWVLETGKIV